MTLEDPDFYPDGRDLGENYTLDLVEHEPLRQVGQARLHALPHLQRPLPVQEGKVQRRLHALP
ncbi:MAG: hypothetical protein M0C28_32815 [Candidatus Moduliflexus flocculans]|nr:hypothetical protein [Candidatus Moduliflexus flocculans]